MPDSKIPDAARLTGTPYDEALTLINQINQEQTPGTVRESDLKSALLLASKQHTYQMGVVALLEHAWAYAENLLVDVRTEEQMALAAWRDEVAKREALELVLRELEDKLQDLLDNFERCQGCHSATCPAYYSDRLRHELANEYRDALTAARRAMEE